MRGVSLKYRLGRAMRIKQLFCRLESLKRLTNVKNLTYILLPQTYANVGEDESLQISCE